MKHTSTELPDTKERKEIMYWYPGNYESWRTGIFYRDSSGEFFQGDRCWYLSDGHTYWMELPPPPETKTKGTP